jgi:hypothetical protein
VRVNAIGEVGVCTRVQISKLSVAAVLLVVGVVACGSGDDTASTATTTSTTTTSTTTGPTATTAPAPGGPFAGIYPFSSQQAADAYSADPGVGMFFDPEATAVEFAREYLGMPAPVSDGVAGEIEDGSAVVDVRARDRLPMVTHVQLTRVGDDGPWTVKGSVADSVIVETPEPLDTVGSIISLSGRSHAFEATVNVAVRADGQGRDANLGEGIVMGGGGAELEPFHGSVTIAEPTTAAGAVVFQILSAEDGAVVEASVVRVVFES